MFDNQLIKIIAMKSKKLSAKQVAIRDMQKAKVKDYYLKLDKIFRFVTV